MATLFMHSSKAVQNGFPADRVFLVVTETYKTMRSKPEFCAWECTLTDEGLIHPAYEKPLKLTHEALLAAANPGKAENGTSPTAIFKEGTYFERCTPDVLQLRLVNLRMVAERTSRQPLPETTGMEFEASLQVSGLLQFGGVQILGSC